MAELSKVELRDIAKLAQYEMDRTWQLLTIYDTRSSWLLAFNALLFASGNFFKETMVVDQTKTIFIFIPLIVSSALALVVIWPRDMQDTDIQTIYNDRANITWDDLTKDFMDGIRSNTKMITERFVYLRIAIIASTFSLVALIALILF